MGCDGAEQRSVRRAAEDKKMKYDWTDGRGAGGKAEDGDD